VDYDSIISCSYPYQCISSLFVEKMCICS